MTSEEKAALEASTMSAWRRLTDERDEAIAAAKIFEAMAVYNRRGVRPPRPFVALLKQANEFLAKRGKLIDVEGGR